MTTQIPKWDDEFKNDNRPIEINISLISDHYSKFILSHPFYDIKWTKNYPGLAIFGVMILKNQVPIKGKIILTLIEHFDFKNKVIYPKVYQDEKTLKSIIQAVEKWRVASFFSDESDESYCWRDFPLVPFFKDIEIDSQTTQVYNNRMLLGVAKNCGTHWESPQLPGETFPKLCNVVGALWELVNQF